MGNFTSQQSSISVSGRLSFLTDKLETQVVSIGLFLLFVDLTHAPFKIFYGYIKPGEALSVVACGLVKGNWEMNIENQLGIWQ